MREDRVACERNSWQQDVARCDWMLGWLDVIGANWTSALARAACRLGEGYPDRAPAACERALDLAAPRNYRLIPADALVLRARIALAQKDPTTARNDAESALRA